MIRHLRRYSFQDPRLVLLDACVWLDYLEKVAFLPANKNAFPNKQRKYIELAREYTTFVDELVASSSGKPKIILPAVLLSEIINSYVRNTLFPIYTHGHQSEIKEYENRQRLKNQKLDPYKHVYRQSPEFLEDFTNTKELILELESMFRPEPCEFGIKYSTADLMSFDANKTDFNDFYYCNMAARNNYVIVTNDGDFHYSAGADIFTLNTNLLFK